MDLWILTSPLFLLFRLHILVYTCFFYSVEYFQKLYVDNMREGLKFMFLGVAIYNVNEMKFNY